MANYYYTAKNLEGKTESGTLEAKDTRQLAQKLKKEGLILIEAVQEEEKKEQKRFSFSLPFLGGISLSEKIMFTRNLQIMIASGLPLTRCLNILSEQAKQESFRKALFSIREEVEKGKSFSQSLSEHPHIFSELFQGMVKAGEESGMLEEVLKTLSFQMEREHELHSRIKGAMIYPAIIITAMIGIGILMLTMVVPQIGQTFEELGIELPPTTQFVINLGNFLAEKWYLFLLIIFLFIPLLLAIIRTKKGKKMIDSFFLKIPIISSIVRKSNSAQTCRTLSSLITTGVPIVKALEITSHTLGNVYFKTAMIEASEKVKKGAELSESLKSHANIYPLTVMQMIRVGEETGQTSRVLAKLAEFFEEEVGNATKNLVSIIEPVLMIIIGVVVGFFAISMIQPMYSMLGSL